MDSGFIDLLFFDSYLFDKSVKKPKFAKLRIQNDEIKNAIRMVSNSSIIALTFQ